MTREGILNRCAGLTTLVLAAAIAGCGDNGPTAPSSGPTVSSTSPANGAKGVAINSGFAATFSEAMDPASITAATFKMTASGGAAVSGAVT